MWAVELVARETRLLTASSDRELQVFRLTQNDAEREAEGEAEEGEGERKGDRGKRKAEASEDSLKEGKVSS